MKYGISTEIDGYLFIGDCAHERIENSSNMIFRSRPGMFSIFDFVNDFLTLKSKPTALANFNGRLYAFDKNNIYRINQQTLSIEDVFEGVGCLNKDSIIVTEYGMFFADRNGAYMHNGNLPTKISDVINQGGDTDVSFGGTDNIRDVSWSNVVTKQKEPNVFVSFNANTTSILFNVEYIGYLASAGAGNIPQIRQYIWSYNIPRQRWDLWELSENSSIGKPFLGDLGELYIPIDEGIYEYTGGNVKRDFTWISKKLTMEEDSVIKVFNKVKLNGLTTNINLDGSYKESSQRIIMATSTGLISTSDVVYSTESSGHTSYKLSGSNKKGRWLQLKLEDMTDNVDSIGIIYRRKSTK